MVAKNHSTKITIRLAAIKDANLVAPLFDAYRQFYGQKSDLKLAKKFISERLSLSTAKNNLTAKYLYQSLGYKLDQTYDHYSLEILTSL